MEVAPSRDSCRSLGRRAALLFTVKPIGATMARSCDINCGEPSQSSTCIRLQASMSAFHSVLAVSLTRQVSAMKITANFPLAKQTRILQDEVTPIAEAKPTYQLAQTAQLQIKPITGAAVVRSLSAKTPVTVLESNNGWSLIASEGKPMGYVATRDLAPMQ
jgi:hypothetical protein